MNFRLIIVAAIGLAILAFNPHIISGARDQLDGAINSWSKSNKSGKKPDTKLVLKSPKFPGTHQDRLKAKTVGTDTGKLRPEGAKSSGSKQGSPSKAAPAGGFGAKAVAVQRAKDL